VLSDVVFLVLGDIEHVKIKARDFERFL